MAAAIDTEQCAGCPAVNLCDHWNKDGIWPHAKGIEPCRPVPENTPRARQLVYGREYNCKPAGPVIDAEQSQRDRFRLRDQK